MLLNLFQKLIPRAKTELPPDSINAWRFWMASESLPTLVAAKELGVFELLKGSALTESDLRLMLGISKRATKTLLWHLESLQLLHCDFANRKYSLAEISRKFLLKSSLTSTWKSKISQMIASPVTPESYERDVIKNAPIKGRAEAENLTPLDRIAQDRFALPAVIASVNLELTKLLGERSVSVESAADTVELPKRYVAEMLAVLQRFGMAFPRNGKWSLTDAGRTYLQVDENNPYHWGGLFDLMSESPSTPRSLLEAILKEKTAPPQENEDAMMEHVMSPTLALIFAKHMNSQGAAAAVAVGQHPVFKRSNKVLDVAGGGGTYAFEIAKQNPGTHVSVMELDPMVSITKEWIRLQGLKWKVSAVEGNMFLAGDWPKGFDTIFFSHVMHDWDLPKIKMLLRNAFSALPAGGKLVLHEVLVGRDGQKKEIATAFSVTLYKWTEGRQYKAAELLDLLRSVGFSVTMNDVSSAHGPSSLIVARKPIFNVTL